MYIYTVQMVSSVHLQRKPDELPIFVKPLYARTEVQKRGHVRRNPDVW